MIFDSDHRPYANILLRYQKLVETKHPSHVGSWPLLNGWNLLTGAFKGWHIVVFKDAGFTSVTMFNGIGELTSETVGVTEITSENRDHVRAFLEQKFNIGKRDAIIFLPPDNILDHEIYQMLCRHELAVGLLPIKIFLSHKGVDKAIVRDFKKTLDLLGFKPWLDEEAMPAGTPLQRGIRSGFSESCAAVFFVTPNFVDEKYLATEVDYAIEEKTKRGDQFAIITLVFGSSTVKGTVPELLHRGAVADR
ncbi:toll/interleukin-1 receptor domain-containing protein, partial [Methylosinus sporium]